MKKSEMVYKLCDKLTELRNNRENTHYSFAEGVIDFLEKEGMEPPAMSIPTKAILNSIEINVGNITTVRIWEPEHICECCEEEMTEDQIMDGEVHVDINEKPIYHAKCPAEV